MQSLEKFARPYAKALFDVALSQEKIEETMIFCNQVKLLFLQEDMIFLLKTPLLEKEVKINFLLELLKNDSDNFIRNFLIIVAQNNRLNLLSEIANLYQKFVLEWKAIKEVTVFSPLALKEDEKRNLITLLEKKFNQTIQLELVIDESLISGIVLKSGDWKFDYSVSGRLDQLVDTLLYTS